MDFSKNKKGQYCSYLFFALSKVIIFVGHASTPPPIHGSSPYMYNKIVQYSRNSSIMIVATAHCQQNSQQTAQRPRWNLVWVCIPPFGFKPQTAPKTSLIDMHQCCKDCVPIITLDYSCMELLFIPCDGCLV